MKLLRAAKSRYSLPLLIAFLIFALSPELKPQKIQNHPHEILWRVEEPLFESIIVQSQVLLENRGNMIWSHPLATDKLRNLALRYGITYSRDGILEDFGRRRIFVLGSAKAILNKQDELRLQYKRFNTKIVLYAFYYTRKARKEFPFLLDRDFSESQLSLCRQVLEQCGDFIWGVFTGDEHFPKVLKTLPKFKEEPTQWPEIKDIDNEVRSQYGFEKFGIPRGLKDRNRFRWSAFYRWLVDKMIDRQKQLHSLVRNVAPHVKILSTDPSSHMWPFEFSRQAPYVDIFTAQMQPFSNTSNITDGGCRAKLYVDLTGKQFWPTPHFNRTTLGYGLSPEEVSRFCSILAISGATGLHIYAKNHYSRPPYLDTGNFFFGAPERKRAVLTACEFLSNFQVKSQTEPDFAIFYSNESNQARREELRTIHAYAFAGPVAGSWFRFIDENCINKQEERLGKYKLIYSPYLTYQSSKVVDKLRSYVKEGGILFLGDPLSFSYNLKGEDTHKLREQLTGCMLGYQLPFVAGTLSTIVMTDDNFVPADLQGLRLPIQPPVWEIKPTRGTRILAKFDDGKPAICLNFFGKGKVIYSGFNFFPAHSMPGKRREIRLEYRIVNLPAWKQFFRVFHHQLGIQTDRAIWRFRLPGPVNEVTERPGQFCLTNNHAEFRNEMAFFKSNKFVEGFYSYKKEPDDIPDKISTWLPFGVGKLTDRRKAVQAGASKKSSDYIVKWTDARGVEINFNFSQKIKFSSLKIIYSGRSPPITLYGRERQSVFKILSKMPASDAGSNVCEIWIGPHRPQFTSEIKIHLNRDTSPANLTISEIEVCGDNTQAKND